MLCRLIVLCVLSFSKVIFALDLELTQGVNAAMPIGIQPFAGEAGQSVSDIVQNDLQFSGQFRIVPPPYGTSMSTAESLRSWQLVKVDSVLMGKVISIGGNRYEVRFSLLDAAAQGRLLLEKNYQVNSAELRALAHHISDEVYQKLTGERGIFSTRIAYVLVNRNADKTDYSLEVADVDGYHPQSLLTSSAPIMSPAWSPNGRQIAYVTFEKKRAQIFIVSVETGRRQLLTDFPGINGAPTWSPDGQQLTVVLSKGGSPKLYNVALSNGSMKQLTFGEAIDTEPRYAPDGRSILFTSGRGGTPQIYRLSLADGQVTRVTYQGNYNARASYTPDQQHIVMLHREDHAFNIGIQAANSSQITTLTSSPQDESPSVAPNGRLILYATHNQEKGVLAIVSLDGRIRMLLPAKQGDVQEPAWSPYLG